ncbi:MAG: efflux RND transporter permease subunit [Deltaproteobacteria bacterium]|nr:efflux RND transporter permease subunit [Deltaproteobacteria bacterium]
MSPTELFIRRPVMTSTLMIAMIFFGVMGYVGLPVSNLPEVDYPTISVSAQLPGADPETMASSVATPLERQFTDINGLRSMSSTSRLGQTTITLQFSLARNIDAAAMDVQAAISKAGGDLPANMPSPPTFDKVNPTQYPIYYLVMSSDAMPMYRVSAYAQTFVIDSLATIPGVAQVIDYSQQKFTVRVRVNPEVLAAREIGINEIRAAVVSQNVNLPLGQLDGLDRTRTVKASGQLFYAKDYEPIIVSEVSGLPVRLSDLGEVRDGVIGDRITSYFNGKRCIVLAVNRQPNSNTIDIVNEIAKKLPAIRASLPPTVKLEVIYDRSQIIRSSIEDVKFTLVLTVVLVVLVVFAFLKSASATLVASMAIPLSIIFTFSIMYPLGFSLDYLSLMSMVLAVGFVVDDAIVVLENIVRHMQMGKKPFQAAVDGSKEIVFTIFSMTSSLAVVFVPIIFMAGIYGRVLREFAVTITIAIIVSGVVAVCMTPMLCSRLLRPTTKIAETGLIYDLMLRFYRWSLAQVLRHRHITLLAAAAILVVSGYMFWVLPKGFIPPADMNYIFGMSISEQGVSPLAMDKRMRELDERIRMNQEVESVVLVSGHPQRNQGITVPILRDKPPRTKNPEQLIQELWPVANSIPGMLTFFQVPPMIQVGTVSAASPYQVILQCPDSNVLFRSAQAFSAAMRTLPQITAVNSDLYIENPEAFVRIDRDKARMFGITPADVEEAVYSAYGDRQISNIYASTDTYKVILQVEKKYQRDENELAHLYIKNRAGDLVRLDAIADVSSRLGPLTVNHYGQLPAVTISFNTAPGFSLGQATDAVRNLAQTTLPYAVTHTFGGTTEAFEEAISSIAFLLAVAIFVIFMILAILYESFIHPLTIISGLPSAALGGLLTLWAFGIELNLYGYVGIFMLMGIVKKNAIMVVDFALEAEKTHGKRPVDAAIEGSLIRFRPIMMTTIAAIAGMIPIAVGYGSGGESRQPLGLAVVGGLLVSQVVTLYLTPVIYSYLAAFQDWLRERGAKSREIRGIPEAAGR